MIGSVRASPHWYGAAAVTGHERTFSNGGISATRTRVRPDGSTAAATASGAHSKLGPGSAAHPKPSFLPWAAGASSRWRSDHAERRRGDRGGLQFAQGEFMSPKRSISEPIHARTNTIVHR